MGSNFINSGAGSTVSRPTEFDPASIRRMLGRFILVRKNERDHVRDNEGGVLIYLTDAQVKGNQAFKCNWNTIVAVSPSCKVFTQDMVGHRIHAPEWMDGMHYLGDAYWAIDERLIGDGNKDDRIKPFTIEME